MPLGSGIYDDLCTEVREKAHADGAIVIVINGVRGNGFSCQASLETTVQLPDLLEDIARQMRASFAQGQI
jgi:hypothetical protein